MARDEIAAQPAAATRIDRRGSSDAPSPGDPEQGIRGYRGARRRLAARIAVSSERRPSTGGWASGLMLALVVTSALLAGAFSLAAS